MRVTTLTYVIHCLQRGRTCYSLPLKDQSSLSRVFGSQSSAVDIDGYNPYPAVFDTEAECSALCDGCVFVVLDCCRIDATFPISLAVCIVFVVVDGSTVLATVGGKMIQNIQPTTTVFLSRTLAKQAQKRNLI